MNFKILNKTLYSCDKWGNIRMKISENVVFGTWDDKTSMFLVTKDDGKLEIRDVYGNILRILAKDAIEGRFQSSDEVVVRRKDGKTHVIDRWGNIRRQL